jgi:hypothetical protein
MASLVMVAIPVSDLTRATENEFAFLAELGLPIVERREFALESYRGGFELTFGGASGKRVTILYSDYEFDVRADGNEIFGASKHDSFAGNMFSREHLIPALPKLRAATEPALRSFAAAAT